MTKHIPSHRTLLASIEAGIGRRMRHLRANLLFRGDGLSETDHAGPNEDAFAELAWLFDDRDWQCQGHEGSVHMNAQDRWVGDMAFALLRLLELRDRLKAMDPWPDKESP